jgi:hypothetical protein
MPKAVIAAFSNPASSEVESEFDSWYEQVHVKEILQIPGVSAATRYRWAGGVGAEQPAHRYLAMYEVDVEPGVVLAEMASGRLTSSDTLDRATAQIACWVPIVPA